MIQSLMQLQMNKEASAIVLVWRSSQNFCGCSLVTIITGVHNSIVFSGETNYNAPFYERTLELPQIDLCSFNPPGPD